jgi:hypothetical protein
VLGIVAITARHALVPQLALKLLEACALKPLAHYGAHCYVSTQHDGRTSPEDVRLLSLRVPYDDQSQLNNVWHLSQCVLLAPVPAAIYSSSWPCT